MSFRQTANRSSALNWSWIQSIHATAFLIRTRIFDWNSMNLDSSFMYLLLSDSSSCPAPFKLVLLVSWLIPIFFLIWCVVRPHFLLIPCMTLVGVLPSTYLSTISLRFLTLLIVSANDSSAPNASSSSGWSGSESSVACNKL